MSDSSNINLERSLYFGLLIMAICYGLEVYMYLHSMHLFLHSAPAVRRRLFMYIFVGTLSLLLTSIVVFTDAVFLELMWIEHRDFAGGPLAYLAANSSIWWQTFGTAANQVTNFLGDGLLLYRCFLIWKNKFWIIAFPMVLYVGSIAMALTTLVQSALPGRNIFRGKPVNFGVPWAILSVSVNIVVTTLIIIRLLEARRLLRNALSGDVPRTYAGVLAILVESALPFSVIGIAFAVTYGKNLDVGPAFLFIWATFCALSPQFIIFRVTNGKSWSQDTAQQTTGIKFMYPYKHGTQESNSRMTMDGSNSDAPNWVENSVITRPL